MDKFKKITSIIPIRTDDFSFYKPRLDLRAGSDIRSVETIVVDDGSPRGVATEIQAYCTAHQYIYVRVESEGERFSLSRARNRGIDSATSEWIIQEDADVVYASDFYTKILAEVNILDDTPFNFLCVPVVYLAASISQQITNAGSVDRFIPRILSRLAIENPKGSEVNRDIQAFAPASALFIARKRTLLHAGAYDELFTGWGGEDRDLAFRLLRLNRSIETPAEFEQTKPWNLNDTVAYEGWRAAYRAIGDYLSLKGLYGYHIFHEPLPWRADNNPHANLNFAKEKAKIISQKNVYKPRADLERPADVIVGMNPYLANAQFFEALDNPKVVEESPNDDPFDYAAWIVAMEPSTVILWNPYGSAWRLQLYKELRKLGANVIVGERGALPKTFYFDVGGLCIESGSYQPALWDHPIEHEEQKIQVADYIDDLRYGSHALESQASRISVGLLRVQLKIPEDKKILFVPLQLSDDTVTTYFTVAGRTYSDYLLELQKLSLRLPRDWVIICKNHPLARTKVDFPGVIVADKYHINDLIEASSAVVLFNSGTGVLSMAFNKPTFYYGKCFYAVEGVNYPFWDAKSLVERLQVSIPDVDREKVLRFYNYLLNKFYSFAESKSEVSVVTETSLRSRLKSLNYLILRIPGYAERIFSVQERLSRDSILFGRYRFYWWSQDNGNKGQAKPQALARAAPQPTANVGENNKRVIEPVGRLSSAAQTAHVELDEVVRKKLTYRVFSVLASPFMSERHARKLNRSPTMFFADSKSLSTRIAGKIIVRNAGRLRDAASR